MGVRLAVGEGEGVGVTVGVGSLDCVENGCGSGRAKLRPVVQFRFQLKVGGGKEYHETDRTEIPTNPNSQKP